MEERSEAGIYSVSDLAASGAGAGAAAGAAGAGGGGAVGLGFGVLLAALPALGVAPSDRRVPSPSSRHLPRVARVI